MAGTGDWFTAANWSHGVPSSEGGAEISNGGTAQIASAGATAALVLLGYNETDSGTLSVTGSGSLTISAGQIYVGLFFGGTGTLNITDGGTVSTDGGCVGCEYGSSGMVTVDGVGSGWTSSAPISLGYDATLEIRNGGHVSNQFAGSISGYSTATVDGTGSTWTTGQFTVVGSLTITNGGSVSNSSASLWGFLSVDGAGSTWSNSSDVEIIFGTLNITNGGTASVAGDLDHHIGAIHVGLGSMLTVNGTFNQRSGGSLSGAGTLVGSGNFSGTISPGDSAGVLTIVGSVALDSNTVLAMEIGGLNAGTEFDQIMQQGGAGIILGGTLELSFTNAFQGSIQNSDTFDIVVSDQTLSGAFDNVASGGRLATSDGLGSFVVTYAGQNAVRLSNFELTPLMLLKAASWKMHRDLGPFPIDLPLTGQPGVECRSGPVAGEHTLVLTFTNLLASVEGVSASATSPSGPQEVPSSGAIGTDQHEYIVDLSGVPNAEYVTVILTGVHDQFGQINAEVSVTTGVLHGDANNNTRVTNTDVADVKTQVTSTVSESNCRYDVNANGILSNTDVAETKGKVSTTLP